MGCSPARHPGCVSVRAGGRLGAATGSPVVHHAFCNHLIHFTSWVRIDLLREHPGGVNPRRTIPERRSPLRNTQRLSRLIPVPSRGDLQSDRRCRGSLADTRFLSVDPADREAVSPGSGTVATPSTSPTPPTMTNTHHPRPAIRIARLRVRGLGLLTFGDPPVSASTTALAGILDSPEVPPAVVESYPALPAMISAIGDRDETAWKAATDEATRVTSARHAGIDGLRNDTNSLLSRDGAALARLAHATGMDLPDHPIFAAELIRNL